MAQSRNASAESDNCCMEKITLHPSDGNTGQLEIAKEEAGRSVLAPVSSVSEHQN